MTRHSSDLCCIYFRIGFGCVSVRWLNLLAFRVPMWERPVQTLHLSAFLASWSGRFPYFGFSSFLQKASPRGARAYATYLFGLPRWKAPVREVASTVREVVASPLPPRTHRALRADVGTRDFCFVTPFLFAGAPFSLPLWFLLQLSFYAACLVPAESLTGSK